MDTLAIYKHGEMGIQTTAYNDNGTIRCRFSGYLNNLEKDQTVEEYLKANPGFECLPFDTVLEEIHTVQDRKLLTEWKEINEDEWMDALECLPPQKWQTVDGVNIFRMCEYTTGNITSHYARTEERYFTASRRITQSYEDMAKEIKSIA